MKIKVNGKLLTILAFLFAAVGSTVCVAILACAAIFGDKKGRGAHSLEALFLSIFPSLVSFVLSVVTLVAQVINISLVLGTLSTVTSIISSVVSIVTFVLCLAAAFNLSRGTDTGLFFLRPFSLAILVDDEDVSGATLSSDLGNVEKTASLSE